MDAPLLATKLFIPPIRPGLIPRPRLIERLRQALHYSLVLVSAPAGYGKTTAIAQWISESRPPGGVAWVSLEDGDNDPVRFWDYFIAALRTLLPSVSDKASAFLRSAQPDATESLLTAVINDTAAIRQDFVVVLEDYHLIKAEAIDLTMTFLLDHLPPKMHVLIATRVDPSLPLARLRGRGTLLEIRANDLRFTPDETTALLKEIVGISLSSQDVGALNARTEGWAVGLKMAALSLRGQPDVEGFLRSFTGSQRYIMDYLVEEVLKSQTQGVRNFLLATSVLEKLTAQLCDALTRREGSQNILRYLEQANLFLVPLDDSRTWYRYHHLFGELLRQQLNAGETATLHQQASQWYEEYNFPEDAIHHALAAKDWERAMRLIDSQIDTRLGRGEMNTVLQWLQTIPEEILRTRLRLYWYYCGVLAGSGDFRTAEAALSDLESLAQGDAGLLGTAAFMRGLLARRRGDISRIIEMAEKALSLLKTNSLEPSDFLRTLDFLRARCRASEILGVAKYGCGLLEEARQLCLQAYETGQSIGDWFSAAQGAVYLGLILCQQGKLREALEMTHQTIELVGLSPASSMARSLLAAILLERNDLDGAVRSAQQSIQLSSPGGAFSLWIDAHYWLARAKLVRGDATGALTEMEQLDQMAHFPDVTPTLRAYLAACHVIFAIRQDDLVAASDWGSRLQKYAELPFDILHVPARLLIARGEKSAAMEQLRACYEGAIKVNTHGLIIAIRVYQALASSNPEEAVAYLSEALIKGEPEGYIRTFVDEGQFLEPILRKALARGVAPRYTAKILDIIESEKMQRKGPNVKTVSSLPSSAVLSAREMEVMRLLAAGLSNRQISERLFVSLGTVKVHVYNIMNKLNSSSRTEAVARARELNLI